MSPHPVDLATDPLLAHVPAQDGGKVLGGVQLLKKLGEGGMGAVYRGRHLRSLDALLDKIGRPPAEEPEAPARSP